MPNPPRTKKGIAEKMARYDRENLECARVILTNPGGNGGDQSLLVVWARLVIERRNNTGEKRISNDAIWKV